MPAGSPTVMPTRGLGMMAAGAAAPLGAAVAAPRRVRAAAMVGAAGVLYAFAVGQLVAETALQSAALPRQLRGIEAQLLLLRHLDRDGLERPEPGSAAERPSARAVAAEDARFVAHADLAHLDAHAEV